MWPLVREDTDDEDDNDDDDYDDDNDGHDNNYENDNHDDHDQTIIIMMAKMWMMKKGPRKHTNIIDFE